MKYPEEAHARVLHDALQQKARRIQNPAVEISVSGGGVHWKCVASRAHSECSTSCFDQRGIPEFLISFGREGETLAWGRSPSHSEVVAAILDWLNGDSLGELYRSHAFVDGKKRALAAITDEVVARHPALRLSAPPVMKHSTCDINYLWFRSATRSCQLSFWGKNPHPDAKFHWDDCELFGFTASDNRRLGGVLARWLVDEAAPSAMRSEFPWLEIGPLADYYEQGNPIEGEFLQSWDRIEAFYQDRAFPYPAELKSFIAEMREQGFDRRLRVGQSMWTMVFSRSRRHGLRDAQPSVAFDFIKGGLHATWGTVKEYQRMEVARIKFSPEIEDLLRWLENEPIT